jgi:hypothetical protein
VVVAGEFEDCSDSAAECPVLFQLRLVADEVEDVPSDQLFVLLEMR